MENSRPMERRQFLRVALATAALAPLGGALAACAAGGSNTPAASSAPSGAVSDTNPFGLADNSTIDAVIFNGGYGIDYVQFAADELVKLHPTVKPKVAPSTNIAQELQPRFVGGNPPDLIDNSGAKAIGISTIVAQLEDLTPVIEAKNIEGTVIKDTLYAGVTAPGTFDGKFVALNYGLTVYALWYSASLFEANSWTPPKTWDDALALGAKAKAKGKYLFVWGKEAATYYQTLAISSAIKEGGDEVRLGLENLKPDSWSHPAIQAVFNAMEKVVKGGYFKPGGSGTQFTAAQAQWTNNEDAILYPSGSWIENEMKKQTKSGFKMTGAPEPTVTSGSKLPYEALHSTAGEPFVVPSKAKNVPGGKEMLRVMLSKDAATNFTKLLDAAGKNIFSWIFTDYYGMNTDQLVVWNSFLDGKSDAAALTKGLQGITDKVAKDSSIKKIVIK